MSSNRKSSFLSGAGAAVVLDTTLMKIKRCQATDLPELRYAQVVGLHRTLSEMAVCAFEASLHHDLEEAKDRMEDLDGQLESLREQGEIPDHKLSIELRHLQREVTRLEKMCITVSELKSGMDVLHDGLEGWVTSPLLASLDHIRGQQLMKGAQEDFDQRK